MVGVVNETGAFESWLVIGGYVGFWAYAMVTIVGSVGVGN